MRASDFVKDKPKRVLTIFDIDDTLFHTTAKINVVKDGKIVRSLTNQQFNNYELQDGEEYDFGEFRNAEKFRQESEPIGPMLDELKTILDHTRGKVIMLTARADFDDKETFLQTFADHGIDMSKIHVHRAGNLPGKEGPAEKKAVWVRRYLDTGRYDQISLYDDSMTNLRVFKSLEDEYPDVEFYAHHISDKGDVNTLEERRKRKKRSKYGALWGPGPYGLYGYNAGYSGVGSVPAGDGGAGGGDGGGMEEHRQINEAWTPTKKQKIKDFALWAIKLLEIEQAPRIKLVSDTKTTALGYFDPDTQDIVVSVKDRHQMDIMRTLAHELVHRKQNEGRELDGSTGSPDENEANALAGVLLRYWGKMNPDQFNEAWSAKYKRSIDCGNPKGFSQRAHCQGRKKDEDQHPNERPRGPETKPTMPKGTVKVDVSDVYDWYKLGQHISDLKGLGKHDFGKGPPSAILSFGDEDLEHEYIQALLKTGLTTTDIDPVDPKQPKWLKRQKVDPTYNVNERTINEAWSAKHTINESAIFLNPNTVIVGQEHGQPLNLSPDIMKKVQAIAAKHGAWYEGNGADRVHTKGQIDNYEGSFDDEVAKNASPNDPKWLYVLFANVDENNRVERVGVDPEDTIFNRLLATAKDNSFQGIGFTEQALKKFLAMSSEGKYDFVKMSQQPATQKNLTRFLKAGEELMWPDNWEQYPNKAGKIAKAATVDARDQYLASRKSGVYVVGSGHLKAVQQITGKQGVEKDLNENFADGRNPQDKGDSKRHGIKKGMSIAQLKKIRSSDSASPRKKQLAHWQINMRQGKKK